MSKSYVEFLKRLYGAILRDCAAAYPQFTNEWTRDHTRLLSIAEIEGSSFFTITLPAFGKHLEQALAAGTLSRSGLAHMRPYSNRTVIPRLFRALTCRVFSDSGELRTDVDIHAVRLLRQLCYAAKKLRMECKDATTYQAVADYFDIETKTRHPTLEWDADRLDFPAPGSISFRDGLQVDKSEPDLFAVNSAAEPDPGLSNQLTTLQHVADRVISGFGSVLRDRLRPKHGPGAVADLRGGVSKYLFPSWPAKLEALFPADEFAFANITAWEETYEDARAQGKFSSHEPPCKLIAVPKTQKGPRLIASEPTSHQWIQQALKRELERMVAASPLKNCINFVDQSISGRAALQASQTGLQCTIDLSSASDRLSCWAVERFFRSNLDLLQHFHAARTRWLVNPIDKKQPKYVVLRKFAPMGCALTFPVQSIVYSIVAIAAVIHGRGWRVDKCSIESASRLVRVYGDDIIAPVDCFEGLTQVLAYLGLKVNTTKSFSTGFFRESCGVDAYAGEDVTPAYVLEAYSESRPESVGSVVECSNNFYQKGLWHTASWLKSTVPQRIAKAIPVVSADSGAFGWLAFQGDFITQRKRWNNDLHREEAKVLTLSSKVRRSPIGGYESLLQYFTECPSPDVVWMAGVDSRPVLSLRHRWVPTREGRARAPA